MPLKNRSQDRPRRHGLFRIANPGIRFILWFEYIGRIAESERRSLSAIAGPHVFDRLAGAIGLVLTETMHAAIPIVAYGMGSAGGDSTIEQPVTFGDSVDVRAITPSALDGSDGER